MRSWPPRVLLQRQHCSGFTIVHTRTIVPYCTWVHYCPIRAYCPRRTFPAASLLVQAVFGPRMPFDIRLEGPENVKKLPRTTGGGRRRRRRRSDLAENVRFSTHCTRTCSHRATSGSWGIRIPVLATNHTQFFGGQLSLFYPFGPRITRAAA